MFVATDVLVSVVPPEVKPEIGSMTPTIPASALLVSSPSLLPKIDVMSLFRTPFKLVSSAIAILLFWSGDHSETVGTAAPQSIPAPSVRAITDVRAAPVVSADTNGLGGVVMVSDARYGMNMPVCPAAVVGNMATTPVLLTFRNTLFVLRLSIFKPCSPAADDGHTATEPTVVNAIRIVG